MLPILNIVPKLDFFRVYIHTDEQEKLFNLSWKNTMDAMYMDPLMKSQSSARR